MKRFLLAVTLFAFLSASTTSCSAVKKDCRGVKHHRLSNGVYL